MADLSYLRVQFYFLTCPFFILTHPQSFLSQCSETQHTLKGTSSQDTILMLNRRTWGATDTIYFFCFLLSEPFTTAQTSGHQHFYWIRIDGTFYTLKPQLLRRPRALSNFLPLERTWGLWEEQDRSYKSWTMNCINWKLMWVCYIHHEDLMSWCLER